MGRCGDAALRAIVASFAALAAARARGVEWPAGSEEDDGCGWGMEAAEAAEAAEGEEE